MLYNNRGVVHQYMRDNASALADYQTAIKIGPKEALPYFNAANVYVSSRQAKQATEYYNTALSLAPNDDSFLANRAVCKVCI